MRTYEIPDLPDTPPDDDEPVEAVRVKCWHCGGGGADYHPDDLHWHKCRACGGTGYTYDTTETEDTEEAEDEV